MLLIAAETSGHASDPKEPPLDPPPVLEPPLLEPLEPSLPLPDQLEMLDPLLVEMDLDLLLLLRCWSSLPLDLSGLTNLETLRLGFLLVPDIRGIWKGLVLSKLTTLKVVKCKRLTHVFTCSMIVSLVQLKVLKILSCEELEQIIAKDDDENDQILLGDHLQSLCFPNLCEIKIRECNKLKSLFPVAMASGLPNLQILRVTKASQFLGVFGQDDQGSPVNVEKEMVLPNLKELTLEQLSSIVCFSFEWCDYFLFPRLEKLKVHRCPKLTTKFATTPDGSMSAQSEVSEVAEDSSINREWTRNNGWRLVS